MLRVVATTLALSGIVVGLLGLLLLSRVSSGLLEAKERSSVAEAAAGQAEAQRVLSSANTGPTTPSPNALVTTAVDVLVARAGSPGVYDIVLLATPPAGSDAPELVTNLVDEASVPLALREAVASEQRQAWTYTTIRYTDGRSAPGLAVGAPLAVPTVGPYEVYHLFPLTQEQDTLDLVRRAVAVTGLLLVLGLVGLAYFVTRSVVVPVRSAAAVADRLSDGLLTERMVVNGEDDLARLAASFNQMATSLQEQIRRLESLSRVQQRFVSDVSHELRTPLTTVRMAADVLHAARADFDPATERSAELLQTQLDRFEELLADLLEISRFDAGAAVLDVDLVDMAGLVTRSVEAVSSLSERSGSSVEVDLPEGPCTAEIDARRIDRVLRNLLSNAIEHGAGRPVTVTLRSDEFAVAIAVRDRGVGLKPGESSLVFNRFWRADPARTRTIGGTGLGLSIALEDARLHGGWLEAWGAPGRGANFRMTLPRSADSVLLNSPIPLEPNDSGESERGSSMPYRGPSRHEVAP